MAVEPEPGVQTGRKIKMSIVGEQEQQSGSEWREDKSIRAGADDPTSCRYVRGTSSRTTPNKTRSADLVQ